MKLELNSNVGTISKECNDKDLLWVLIKKIGGRFKSFVNVSFPIGLSV